MFLLWTAFAHAACPATSADLGASLEASEAAFADMDIAGFLSATNRVTAEANCLRESAPRSTIARLHRVEGLRAFVDKDAERAARAFASARAIEPGYTFPEALVPADHPVRAQYATLDPSGGATLTMPPPTTGYLTVDGRTTNSRPEGRPLLFQLVAEDGSVHQSRYFWPDEPMWEYPGSAAVSAAVSTTVTTGITTLPTTSPPVAREKRGPNVPLALAAGGTLLAAGATLLVANGARSAYYAEDTTPAELDGLRSTTNTFFLVSVGSGVATVGLAVGAVVAGRW